MSCKEFTVSETKLSLPWVFVAEEEKENKMKLMRVISKDLVFEMYSTSSMTCEGKCFCRAQEEETVMKETLFYNTYSFHSCSSYKHINVAKKGK